ncbi:MAG TPA: trehalose-phosphatase [Brevundimonas sp.]|uniref:trehalose-phosphatase n=1 Tax=Brevundimonas sp. TaxID=1871086 RepID=UPI002638C027|nr:trehalose-phosphatase [Brevundimonas sp.]HRO32793.1 trehalose-phosphatase [Brevundimonas sp.]
MPSPAGHADLLPPPLLDADRIALFLDMDGVLAPIMATPEAVTADARRTAVLRRLAVRLNGRLAIISGRTLSEIDRITDGAVASAAGVHGLERRHDGAVRSALADPALGEAVAAFRDFARSRPGAQVEDKGLSTALHYRLAPDHAHAALDLARDLAAATGLRLQGGDMVVELRTPGADKGSALTAFMQTAPFAGAVPVMLGDDLTDEDAFVAAAALGGQGVLVGPPRATAAVWRLPDQGDILDWLETLAGAPA